MTSAGVQRLLAIDTATEACSVALLCEGGVIGRLKLVGRGHGDEILEMVNAVLDEAGLQLRALDGIAVSVGPGSFTGVRICVSVAQGLAFGAGLPVVGVTTLEALALQAMRGGGDHVLACLDARMGEIYWGCFSPDVERGVAPRSEPAVGPAAAIRVPFKGAFTGIGRGFGAYAGLRTLPGVVLPAGADEALPDAADVVRLGALRLAAGEGVDPDNLRPVYLRDKVALTEIERAGLKQTRG